MRFWQRQVETLVSNDTAVKLTAPTQSKTDETKKLLSANTAEALAEGSFGLPWYVGEFAVILSS